jgi:hypothetical protein
LNKKKIEYIHSKIQKFLKEIKWTFLTTF